MDFVFKLQSRIMIKTKTIPGNHLLINLPRSWVLKFIARTVLLCLVIISFPWIGSVIPISSSNTSISSTSSAGHVDTTPTTLPMLFQDLTNEGLFKVSDRALFVHGEFSGKILIDNGVDLVSEFDVERQSSIPDNTFDLVFTSGFFLVSEFIDRTLKNNGIVVVELSNDLSKSFNKPENYKIVYIRRFESTFIAMRKVSSLAKRRLLSALESEKKAALNGLEDPLLEPPRGSSKYMKKTKFLPDLLGDSLDEYSRRIFIDVGSTERNGAEMEWFKKNYPTRNRVFEMYKIEMVSEASLTPQPGVSDWLRKNVKEEEYVVMKAEAEAVEEMMSSKAISLVDELFLECKHQWQKKNKGRRAYWECLALYGRLRDEGVAVHQWWG